MLTLNIIGAGKLGATLGRLWQSKHVFSVSGVCNLNPDSATDAKRFIGAPLATTKLSDLAVADCWLIATPDDRIEACAHALADSAKLNANSVVFHCSGALTSEILHPLCKQTELLASVHPAHSFANPEQSCKQFDGAWCGAEGSTAAIALLQPAFEAIGGQVFTLQTATKVNYHAATVMACNHLIALMDASLECFESAGVTGGIARQLLSPLVQHTLINTLEHGCERALTGPVSRGDTETVRKQISALQEIDTELAQIYQLMSSRALRIAQRQNIDHSHLQQLQQLLNSHEHDY